MSRQVLTHSISIVLALASIAGFWWWLTKEVTAPALTITAALDVPDHGLPVYAQFNATQTLFLADPVNVTQLTVPVYFPAETSKPLVIELWRYDTLVDRWRYYPKKFGVVVPIDLPLVPARLVDGNMSVHFAADSITHDQRDSAPRLFVETADTYYPDGNYQIAHNPKSGDIALTLEAQSTHLDLVLREIRKYPLKVASRGARWLLLATLLAVTPSLINRPEEKAHLVGSDRRRHSAEG